MTDTPQWERDGRDWPNREASRFVRAAGIRWHVQEMGANIGNAPVVLLLHGTGSSTHSWAGLMPILAERCNVIALDLPGHGFTQTPPREFLSTYGMALAVKSLVNTLGKSPDLIVGHSAGAAVGIRMALDGLTSPRGIVGLNAALLPFSGFAGQLFAPMARALARIPFVPHFFARRAFDRATIARMLADTGSKSSARDIDLYHRLAQWPSHVAAAIGMMAEWDLPKLSRDLPRLKTPLGLIVGTRDRTIPPEQADRVRKLLPSTQVDRLDDLGHLAHEEAPARVAEHIGAFARTIGLPHA
jgi:magnesium chelatase accessory protein